MSADTVADSGQLEEVVVTATKRSENAQDVPSSIEVLSSATLENLGVKDFNDYALLVPSLSFTSTGPGSAKLYFRGLSDGSVNLVETSGVQPTVAVYLDEQLVTNAGRSLDLEIYDIERIEALSGPQGTLFGSSSEAGTVRIITKAPNTAAEEFGTDFSYAVSPHGDPSYKVEGFANIPLSDKTALRLVGWSDQQGGYINNVTRTFTYTFPSVADTVVGGYPTINNSLYAKSNFNSSGKEGLRVAVRTMPNDNWTIDAKFITQRLTSQGVFDVDPALGGDDLNVARYFNDSLDDVFRQYSITANGKFGGFDLTYAGSYFDRNVTYTHDYSMYSDYSLFIAPYYTCQNNGAGVLVPGVVFFVSGNAGKATDNGGEFDLSFRPTENLTLSLNGAYIDAHLTQSFCLGGSCGTPSVIWHAPSGTQLAFVPKEKGSVIARYEFPWSSSVQGHAQVSTSFTGSSWSTMFIETRGPQPSYSLTNLKLGAAWGHWASDLYCDNVLDKRAVLFINRSDYDFYQGDQYGRETIARPLTVGITLSYRH